MEVESKQVPSKAQSKLFKLDTIGWISLSIFILYYFDVIGNVKNNSNLTGYAYTGALCFTSFSIFTCLYFVVWCGVIKKIHSDNWEEHAPLGIPIATGAGVLASLCWNFALWEIYGIKTPFITFSLFMGFVMVVSLIPSNEEPNTTVKKID